jgi:hypothetical protein
MPRLPLLVLLLFSWLSVPVLGQSVSFSADTTHAPDWLRTQQQLLSLPRLPVATHAAQFRLYAPGQVVEGWQTLAGSYGGQVLNWVQEVNPKDEVLTNRLHLAPWALDSATVRELFRLLQHLHLRALPDERNIVGWQPMLDGISYTLEYATTTSYAVKSYGNPASQGTLPQAQRVRSFVTQTVEAEATVAQRRAFEARIPFPCYTDGGGTITCHILSATARRKYKRERKRDQQSR